MEFEPHPFLRDAHAMTLAGLLPREFFGASSRPMPPGESVRARVDDETELMLWLHRQPDAAQAPLALLLHGLSGDADSRYIVGLGSKLFARGFHVARMNMRNCGGSEALTPTFYCTALSGDVFAAARAARDSCGSPRVHICGWSMGGNMVLKLAGELGSQAPTWLTSVAAVSPATDPRVAQRSLDEIDSNAPYRRHFLREMLALFRRKEARYPQRYSSRGLEHIDTFLEWDEVVTAPHFGFANAADFYLRAASRWLVRRIHVPVCVVHAEDDPFVPFAPWRDAGMRPAGRFQFHAPRFGGHCGFIAGSRGSDGDRFWAEQRVSDFFAREDALALGASDP